MAVKNIIFDLDGVLVSTDDLHYQGWKKLADREGIYFDRRINDRLRGVSRLDSLKIILERAEKEYTDEQMQEMCTYKNNYYVNLLDTLSEESPLPGVVEGLEKLKAAGFKLAVGSSSKNAGKILSRTGLEKWFDAVADGNDISHSKPDPEVFLVAAKKLGEEPAGCAVIEDAEAGIRAAHAAGMESFAIGDARKSEFADHKINGVGDLPELLIK